jgi:hypothetical protein
MAALLKSDSTAGLPSNCLRSCRLLRAKRLIGEAETLRRQHGQRMPLRSRRRRPGYCGAFMLIAQTVAQTAVASTMLMLTRCVSCAIFPRAWQGWQAWQSATIVAKGKRSPFADHAHPSLPVVLIGVEFCTMMGVASVWQVSPRSRGKQCHWATRRPRHAEESRSPRLPGVGGWEWRQVCRQPFSVSVP